MLIFPSVFNRHVLKRGDFRPVIISCPHHLFREVYLPELRSVLGEKVFMEASGQGQKLKLEKVVALALTDEQQK